MNENTIIYKGFKITHYSGDHGVTVLAPFSSLVPEHPRRSHSVSVAAAKASIDATIARDEESK